MSSTVIREDVVRVNFDIGGSLKEIQKLKNDMDELKKKLTGGIDGGAFDDLKNDAEEAKDPIDKLKESTKKLKDEMSDLGKKAATTAFNGLKKVASISFKALLAGAGAVATAIGKIAYESVQAFADFEQLKGGVETLFGAKGAQSVEEYAQSLGKSVSEVQKEYDNLTKAQDIVLGNANDAYKTAGLSANDYLETVTSFSASLIQSVGGDTLKAAELADQAIIDMADNANKMGTDMGSIQYAYQGFAKQNYTMLDNLKLGYGGTKEEMQRLIKDAAKLDKSVKSNDMSYANIVKAIHAVQKNMSISGITYEEYTELVESGAKTHEEAFALLGTTAKEANFTVTGSMNQMKGAWENVLTALGSGEALDEAFDNFIESFEIFGKNIIPVAERALIGMGTLVEKLAPIIEEKLPALAEQLLPPLIRATVTLVKGLIKALPNIIKTVFSTLSDILGEQFPALGKFFDFFANNSDTISKFIPIILGLVGAFMAFNKIKSIGSALSGLFGGSKGGAGKGGGGLFGGMFDSLAKMKPTTILKGMANLALIMGGFALITAAFMVVAPALAEMDLAATLKMVVVMAALGVLGSILTKVIEPLGKMKITEVLKGLANMAIVLAGLSVIYLLIGALSLIKFDLGAVLSIVGIIGALGLVGAILTVFAGIVGMIPVVTVALGLANMAIIIAGMAALYLLIGALSLVNFDLSRILKIVAILGVLGIVGGVLTIFAGICGMIPTPVVLAGLTNMGLVLGGISALIVAFGALAEIEGFTYFLEKGGEILVKIMNIIGEMVGALIGGALEGISKSLPVVGENLAEFGENIKPLFESMSGVDMGGVGAFFTSLGTLFGMAVGNDIVSGIKSLFGDDESSFAKLGTDLTEFGKNAAGFFKTVADYPEEGFTKAKLLFESLADVGNLPNTGGVAQWFTGETDWDGVATGLGKLAGDGVKAFFTMVEGLKEEAFNNAKLFFECLDGVGSLPNSGGMGQWFSGKNDFKGVANGLTSLSGEGVKAFFAMVQDIDESTFTKVTSLFESLSAISKMPKEDNWWNKSFGSETMSLGDIASDLGTFAEKTTLFFEQVNSLNLKNLNGLWKSLQNAGKLTTKNLGKAVDDSISTIVDKISELPQKMGEALQNNSEHLSNGMVEMWKDAVKASVAPVNKLLEGANHILKEFGSKKKVISWEPYARGTDGHKGGNALVNDGAGAELIQMPNGRTFLPRGRNVFIPNAPKGMKVLPADRTAQLMGKASPTFRYADGIGNIDVWKYYDNAKGLIDKITGGISYEGLSSLAASMGEGMVSTFANEMPAWVDKLFEENGQSIGSYVASKGVTQWLPTVVRALKMEGQYSLFNVARTLFQMKTESGGNPKAINLWDSNAKKGIPSKGLMQVIDPTFKAYAREGFNKNIYDPLSNILASIRYAVSRYGSLARAYRGVGYSNGGLATETGTIVENPNHPEWVIPTDPSKRKRALNLYRQAGKSLGLSYSPEGSGNYYETNTAEYNTYSPQFNFTISGSNDDRILARKIKKAVSEAITDMVEATARG